MIRSLCEVLHIPLDRALRERVRWLISARWAILLFVALVFRVANRWIARGFTMPLVWRTLGAMAAYNLLLGGIARCLSDRDASHKSHILLMHLQIAADMVALTVFLHCSGGLESLFAVYYMPLIVIGSMLMGRRAGYYYAGAATALWFGLLILEAVGLVPSHGLGSGLRVRSREVSDIFAEGIALVMVNFGIAYLVSSVTEGFCESKQRLADLQVSCDRRVAELTRLNEQLQELDRARSSFVRMVTHELRAPTAAIQSYLQLILEGYVPENRLREIIAKAEHRARDQLDLIGDLLDLAHLQHPADGAKGEPSDAAAALRDVLDMMQAQIKGRHLSVRTEVEPGLPFVAASAGHIKQVWLNLISNAVKYTEPGGEIAITLGREGHIVRGSVQDTGIGLTLEEQRHVFDEFYRTEAAKAMSRHGTGLGLAIVRSIVQRYGGRVWLESEMGHGTTFFFEIPVAE